MSDALKAGLIGGSLGLVVSFLLNYFVFPMPDSVMGVAVSNGISGLISGFLGGFLGIVFYLRGR